LALLRCCEADVIYLFGDIINFWRVRRGPHWPQAHNDVLQKLLRKVRKGTRVVLIPGNHDEALRDCTGLQFGRVEVHRDCLHTTALGHNCGDWVESCTAVVESRDGQLRVLRWSDRPRDGDVTSQDVQVQGAGPPELTEAPPARA
jgi:UDP-2,3-diacylglucosamine pyrophosphatase LpxH